MSATIIAGVIHLDNERTALQIAEALIAPDGSIKRPTDEQRQIIESRHFGPSVIVAGAGSGKTETMTQRVLWLVSSPRKRYWDLPLLARQPES